MTEQKPTTTVTDMLRFFMPLAITWMLMMFTHTIISAGLARTVDPTVSTAAYAVALSLAAIIEAPSVMLRQTGMALIRSPQSFRAVQRVAITTMGLFMLVAVAIGYLPAAGRLVFQDILGVADDLLRPTTVAFRVTMLLPVASTLRCLYQSLILLSKRTTPISFGMFIRVGFMIFLISAFAKYHWVVGPLVGAITLVSGILIEGTNAYIFGRRLVPSGDDPAPLKRVWAFYLPLVASSLLVSMGKPFINGGLARMPNAAVGLAAFSVASSFAWVFISPSQNIHQVTMVFAGEEVDRALVKKFSAAVAFISTAILLVIAFSPLGRWILTALIKVPYELVEPTVWGIRTLAVFPLIICWLEYNTGLLLLGQASRLVSLGKTLNLAATIVFILLLAPLFPGAIAAPLAQLMGFATEGAVLHYGLRRQKQTTAESMTQPVS